MDTEKTANGAGESSPAPDGSAPLSDKQKFELMARKVIWALKYLTCRGSGMLAYGFNDPNAKAFKMVHWTQDFCDALDEVGIHVDREALDRLRSGKKAKAKKPNARLDRQEDAR